MKYTFILALLFLLPSFLRAEEQKGNKKFDYFYLESLRLQAKGESSEAFHALQHALRINPNSAAALREMSRLYIEGNKFEDAIKSLEEAVQKAPGNLEYKTDLAALYGRLGQYQKAAEVYELLAKELPDKIEPHLYLSEYYIHLREFDKAIESLNNLENNIGLNEIISTKKYQLYLYIKEPDKALNEIEKLMEKYPQESKYPLLIGDYYLLEQNNPDKALTYYQKAYEIDPNNAFYFVSMANYYASLGDNEAMYSAIEKALLNPTMEVEEKLQVLSQYVQYIVNHNEDQNKLSPLLEILIEQHPQDTELNVLYGDFLLAQGRKDEAYFQFQLATDTDPENREAWNKLLNMAIQSNHTEQVIEISNRALIFFSDAPEFYYSKGIAYLIQDNPSAMLDTFEEAIEQVSSDDRMILSEFHLFIGDYYQEKGDMKKAYEHYEESLEYNENNAMVLNNYAYFLALDKTNLDKAERMSARTIQLEPENTTYLDTYAWVFFQKGNYTMAKFYIETALSQKNTRISSDMLEHYGDILYMNGKTEKALEQWNKALLLKESNKEEISPVLKKKIKDKKYYEDKK